LAKLLEGKLISEQIKSILRGKIQGMRKRPRLASIQIGVNPAADVYIKSQKKSAELLGIEYDAHVLAKETTEESLVGYIGKLNDDASVSGIIVQMPLPLHMDYRRISQYVTPGKDVEGMHPVNMGKIVYGKAKILPCTAAAVMELLNSIGFSYSGKEAVIVGHSEIVGKPLALTLLDKLATVTVCHIGTSKAGRLEEHVRRADILIVAVGKPGVIKGDWVKEGAIVVDVGINRVGDKLVGDVEFETAEKRAAWITPVPGGVGPLTVTMLMRNVVEASL
jgi:methylenetetrahydrofolate dehydrogenase (NADP+) / methenyltetrahydrofolate cyclohydrolase